MAKRKKTSAPKRRRSASKPVRRSVRRRGTVQKMGMGDLVLGIAGAFAVQKFGDKLPVQNPIAKAGILTAVGLLGAIKGPREFRPLFVGIATYSGLVGVNAAMAQVSAGNGTGTGTGDGTTVTGMGRISSGRGAELRRAVADGLRARAVTASMNGRINGRINGTIGSAGRGSIFNR